MTEPTRPPTDAAPPEIKPDALVARYLEAAELLVEQRPDAQLRAAVLAQAQLQAWKHADGDDEDRIAALDEAPFATNPVAYDATQKLAEGDFYTELPLPAGAAGEAANDRRWRLPAIASVAILGLAGLLSLQFQRSPDNEQQRALGRPAALPPMALTESDSATTGTASPANSASPAPAASVATDGALPKPEAQALARTEAPASSTAPSAPSANPAAGPHRPERQSPRTVPTKRQTAPGQAEPRHERPSGQPNTAGGRPEVTAAETAPQAPPGKAGTSASAERRAATPITPAARRADRPGTAAADSASASIAAASSRPARTSAAANAPNATSPLAGSAVDDGVPPLPPPPTHWSLAPPSRAEAGAEAAGAVRAAPSLTPSQRLLAAAAQGRVDEARRALADGAPVEASDTGGRTALMLAAQRGNVELTRLLTGAGADPRRPDARGHDAIDHARRAGNEALARFLEQPQAHAP